MTNSKAQLKGAIEYQIEGPVVDAREGYQAYQNQLVALRHPNYGPVGWQEYRVRKSLIHAMDNAEGEAGKPAEGLV